ncbi:penicillin-binding protein 2 [Spirochaetia bacterium 38H-sp]|uniref:Penicillin-binding protein 2 n=1 Tax=Rarispira pelagica TaxID=3141764 RepID=A0ABU9UAP6_9SPIR
MGLTVLGRKNNHRLVLLMIFVIILFIIYIFRLFYLQIIAGNWYQNQAKENVNRDIILIPKRGDIFDTNFSVRLATSYESFSLYITPGDVPAGQLEEELVNLSLLLKRDNNFYLDKVKKYNPNTFSPILLDKDLSFSDITRIAENISNFPAISWQKTPIRFYPYGNTYSHLIGYVGEITSTELKTLYNKGYTPGEIIGKTGLEKQYEKILKGKSGKLRRIVDARGQIIDEKINKAPESGKDLIISIDPYIQELSQKALGERNGAVVVLKPVTGELLALYSYPTYDPNLFFNSKTGSMEFKKLSLDPSFPFINRAIQSTFPPASTFKLVMSTAALAEKDITEEETVFCSGSYIYGDRAFNCWVKTGHGVVNLRKAVAQSCDVYFYKLGAEKLGVEKISQYANMFGFGNKTNIDLPGEVAGIVPNPKWKKDRFNYPWLGGDTVNMSIGQGFLAVTPIQMADMIAMIVNNGYIITPHIVKEIKDPVSGYTIESHKPEILTAVNINEEIFIKLKELMRAVITEGTAKSVITTNKVAVAGKTGTGEVGLKDRFVSWFAAYAPYDTKNPNDIVVVVVLVDASNNWEWWAPKAANIIFHGIFTRAKYNDIIDELKRTGAWYLY